MHAQRSSFRRIAVAIAAFATIATLLVCFPIKCHFGMHVEKHRILRNLQELPSLRLRFTIKRDSMFIFGASQFDVFANPVATTNGVAYDGITTSLDTASVRTYLLVDGIAYHVTETMNNGSTMAQDVSCLAPSDVPPVHEVL